MTNILQKIKKAKLSGRGGAAFPTASKWEAVKKAKDDKKFVVCNLSEGEPGVKKDKYILDYHMEEAIAGIKIAIDYLGAERAYIYINHKYYLEYHHRLRKIIKDAPITVFKKDMNAGYIGGAETAALNHIEGKKIEPRLKPPFPTTVGLWGHPTLVNNLETFYDVFLISEDKYKNERLYTINGDCHERGVYSFPEDMHISDVLRKTDNYPNFDFFVQVGGDASGEVLNNTQLDRAASGSASITVYSKSKHLAIDLMRDWVKFFRDQSCGQCTPCREGLIRLYDELSLKEPNWEVCGELLNSLSETSYCALGGSAPVAIRSYVENILSTVPNNKIIFPNATNDFVCGCLN